MRYRKQIVTFFLPAAVLTGIALSNGCAHDSTMQPTSNTPVSASNAEAHRTEIKTAVAEPAATPIVPANPENQGATTTSTPVVDPTAGEKLTDEKIIKVTHVAHEGEMQQAKLALRRGTDPSVKAYAKEMLRDHGAADMKGDRVAAADNIQPADSATSDKLKNDAARTFEDLSSKQGGELDRAYMAAQVSEHSEVLKLIDDRLLPSATDPAVKNLVMQIRPAVAKHLEQALTLQAKLKE